MKTTRAGWFAAGLVAGIAGTLLVVTAAVPLAGAGQNTSRIVLENARVRVKEAVFQPNVPKPGMHTHDLPHVGVVIDGGKMIFRAPDGTTETMTLERGGVGYRDANVTHEPVNLGTTPVRVIEVELK
jgi:mannose-6-phosphate isomerase-like protein (cupin superfamily)